MPTTNYGWPKLQEGSASYPQAHSALVDQIDAELKRVERQSGGGGGGSKPNTTVVTNSGELRSAFNNLSDGGHVHIVRESGAPPLEITDYLDIDASDVLVTGQGTRPMITVPNGGNTGGFRIGYNSHCERVTIRGISYDGNGRNQTMNSGGFGIGCFDVSDVTVVNCDIRETAPHHEHNQNNSGVTMRNGTYRFALINNHFEDIGDRAMEATGNYGLVFGNTSKDGFDRMIGLTEAEGRSDAYSVAIIGNRLDRNAQGSMIGGGSYSGPAGQIIIMGNVTTGHHRTFCRISSSGADITIANNEINGYDSPDAGIEVKSARTSIVNNHVRGYEEGIITIAEGTQISNNRIEDCRRQGIWCAGSDYEPGVSGLDSRRSVVHGNVLRNNCSESDVYGEIRIDTNRVRATNNQFLEVRNGVSCFENPTGNNAVIAWNIAPVGANLFEQKTQSLVAKGNIN